MKLRNRQGASVFFNGCLIITLARSCLGLLTQTARPPHFRSATHIRHAQYLPPPDGPTRLVPLSARCGWGGRSGVVRGLALSGARKVRSLSVLRSKSRVVDELSKQQLFSRLKQNPKNLEGPIAHDDVVVRFSTRLGREKPIPQAERYRGRDWVHILAATPSSLVLRRIAHPLFFNVLWALVVSVAQALTGTPQRSFIQVHALLGSALGLLLVFRTNAAYQRFWEGRVIWEALLSDSRALARLVMLYRKEFGRERVKRATNLICAFPFVLAEHLGAKVNDDWAHLMSREDLLLLNRVGNRPLGVANTLAVGLKDIPDRTEGTQILFSSRERLSLLGLVDKITKSIGACERLVQTPVPLNYARHTSRFLSLWCLTLPLALVGDLKWLTVPITAVTCWALFGIQEIGLMIEEPFRRSLRLDIITRTIYADVQETTYLPEWAKRSKLEKRAVAEAKRQANERRVLYSANTTSSNATAAASSTVNTLVSLNAIDNVSLNVQSSGGGGSSPPPAEPPATFSSPVEPAATLSSPPSSSSSSPVVPLLPSPSTPLPSRSLIFDRNRQHLLNDDHGSRKKSDSSFKSRYGSSSDSFSSPPSPKAAVGSPNLAWWQRIRVPFLEDDFFDEAYISAEVEGNLVEQKSGSSFGPLD